MEAERVNSPLLLTNVILYQFVYTMRKTLCHGFLGGIYIASRLCSAANIIHLWIFTPNTPPGLSLPNSPSPFTTSTVRLIYLDHQQLDSEKTSRLESLLRRLLLRPRGSQNNISSWQYTIARHAAVQFPCTRQAYIPSLHT